MSVITYWPKDVTLDFDNEIREVLWKWIIRNTFVFGNGAAAAAAAPFPGF